MLKGQRWKGIKSNSCFKNMIIEIVGPSKDKDHYQTIKVISNNDYYLRDSNLNFYDWRFMEPDRYPNELHFVYLKNQDAI